MSTVRASTVAHCTGSARFMIVPGFAGATGGDACSAGRLSQGRLCVRALRHQTQAPVDSYRPHSPAVYPGFVFVRNPIEHASSYKTCTYVLQGTSTSTYTNALRCTHTLMTIRTLTRYKSLLHCAVRALVLAERLIEPITPVPALWTDPSRRIEHSFPVHAARRPA